MNWNHRVIRFKDQNSDSGYRHEFREVFYDDEGNKTGYSNPFMWSEDIEGMQELAERLLKATTQPVLEESDFPVSDEDKVWQRDAEAIGHLRALINMGYAAVAFTPEELNGADPDAVQSRLIELSGDVIDYLSDEYHIRDEET